MGDGRENQNEIIMLFKIDRCEISALTFSFKWNKHESLAVIELCSIAFKQVQPSTGHSIAATLFLLLAPTHSH